MEEQKSVEKTSEKRVSQAKRKNVLKKLDADTAKLLQALKDKANRKTFGRKVRDTEVIGLGLSLISADHIQNLQNQTLSEKDRLHMAHEEYQKTNGKITMDQFIGKLLKGEVSANKN